MYLIHSSSPVIEHFEGCCWIKCNFPDDGFPFPCLFLFSSRKQNCLSTKQNRWNVDLSRIRCPVDKKTCCELKTKKFRYFILFISEQATKAGLGMKTGHERLRGRSAVGMILAILWGVVVRVKTRFNTTRSLVTIKSLQL